MFQDKALNVAAELEERGMYKLANVVLDLAITENWMEFELWVATHVKSLRRFTLMWIYYTLGSSFTEGDRFENWLQGICWKPRPARFYSFKDLLRVA